MMRLKNHLAGFITETKSTSLRKASFLVRPKHVAVKQMLGRSYQHVIKPTEIKLTSHSLSHPMSNSMVFGFHPNNSPKPLVGKKERTPIFQSVLAE